MKQLAILILILATGCGSNSIASNSVPLEQFNRLAEKFALMAEEFAVMAKQVSEMTEDINESANNSRSTYFIDEEAGLKYPVIRYTGNYNAFFIKVENWIIPVSAMDASVITQQLLGHMFLTDNCTGTAYASLDNDAIGHGWIIDINGKMYTPKENTSFIGSGASDVSRLLSDGRCVQQNTANYTILELEPVEHMPDIPWSDSMKLIVK